MRLSIGADVHGTHTSAVSIGDIIDLATGNNGNQGASGGVVLYPKKPNTNSLEAIYSK